ncbi:hypothetical protein GCM10010193_08900 [Kitasatospora atroaurantiaca]|uniref:Uncharacterized protein n=1 Tax=Kitasatospora atroaurantiaca TaxID=285545 RepID=A0A561ERV5_9ACTN|nr:hypothetical protein [Kitasatospora atroaurantiaca]TWE18343.1 hypothetical protein FB465_3410 [Kitasatospora atroaurantiaca]
MFTVSRETKATLVTQAGGKVVGWHNDKEARHVSIAVPGDRAKLTPVEARNLAAWLIDAAREAEKVEGDRSPLRTATLGTAERVARW